MAGRFVASRGSLAGALPPLSASALSVPRARCVIPGSTPGSFPVPIHRPAFYSESARRAAVGAVIASSGPHVGSPCARSPSGRSPAVRGPSACVRGPGTCLSNTSHSLFILQSVLHSLFNMPDLSPLMAFLHHNGAWKQDVVLKMNVLVKIPLEGCHCVVQSLVADTGIRRSRIAAARGTHRA